MSDPLDLLTYDEGKQAVAMSTSRAGADDTNASLEQAITGISRLLDDLCGPIVVRTITDELVDAPNGDLWTRYSPLYSVSSVKEYVSGSATTLAAETLTVTGDYRIVGAVGQHDRRIQRRSGWNAYSWSGQVLITYVAGRYADTASVDPKFKLAASEILQGTWTKYGSAWSRGGDPLSDPQFFDEVTQVVNRLLWNERLGAAVA